MVLASAVADGASARKEQSAASAPAWQCLLPAHQLPTPLFQSLKSKIGPQTKNNYERAPSPKSALVTLTVCYITIPKQEVNATFACNSDLVLLLFQSFAIFRGKAGSNILQKQFRTSSISAGIPPFLKQLWVSSRREGIGVIGELVTELFVSPISAIPPGADLSCPIPRYFSLSSNSGGPTNQPMPQPLLPLRTPAGWLKPPVALRVVVGIVDIVVEVVELLLPLSVGRFVAWFTSFTDNSHLQSAPLPWAAAKKVLIVHSTTLA